LIRRGLRAIRSAVRGHSPGASAADRLLASSEFDVGFYLSSNADVASSGLDPLDHFLRHGWLEGRDPSPGFSVADYLDAYPDVASAGLNPFVHYLRSGRAEGRLARSPLGFRYQVISRLKPMEDRLAEVRRALRGVKTGTAAALVQALSASRGSAGLHLSFSHDDYTANLGGVQLCLQREGARAEALGLDHLHVYPAKAWPVVRTAEEPAPLGVVWNGRAAGSYTLAAILEALKGRRGRSLAIHSLLGHAAGEVVAIARALELGGGVFWVHDFASLCAGYHLLRNDVADCGAPPPESAACGVCLYGPWRRRHLEAHEQLFRELALTAAAPSEHALQAWRAGWSFPAAGAVVHPNATLVPRAAQPAWRTEGPLRFAFLGLPMPLKGWPIFRDLALKHAGDPRYEFLHLGQQPQAGLPIGFHPVQATHDRPRAMQEALEALQVDAALIWPLCQETFSFTAYEAAAAGAAILTGPDSGNVAAFVAATGLGQVLPDEASLEALFHTGAALQLAQHIRKPSTTDIKLSNMTMDLA
jgi:hypothetical protein